MFKYIYFASTIKLLQLQGRFTLLSQPGVLQLPTDHHVDDSTSWSSGGPEAAGPGRSRTCRSRSGTMDRYMKDNHATYLSRNAKVANPIGDAPKHVPVSQHSAQSRLLTSRAPAHALCPANFAQRVLMQSQKSVLSTQKLTNNQTTQQFQPNLPQQATVRPQAASKKVKNLPRLQHLQKILKQKALLNRKLKRLPRRKLKRPKRKETKKDNGLLMILKLFREKLVIFWGKENLGICTWHVKNRANLFLH